jgi:hypothetical protein
MHIGIFSMALYGIYGSHTTESCPLNNIQSRKIVLNMIEDLDNIAKKNRIKILEQYHSALEHTFLWTVDTENAHSVERFMIESGWAAFNAIKIVPLGKYQNVIEACKKLGTS